jgi:enamine deaminase RidA (YjgF/YER057c/UK114 family)
MKTPSQRKSLAGRREFLGGALAGAGGSLAAVASRAAGAESTTSSKAKITALHPKGAPAADVGYSPGILAQGRRVVVVSGQGPEDLKADMETQIRQTFRRIGFVLEAAGASFENVVLVRSYFVHLARDLAAFRKVRREFLCRPYPASTAVGVTELAIPGLEIEIEATAVI